MTTGWPLSTKPYDVQALAFNKGRDQECFAYYIEMGLGKTSLCLADFVYNCMADRCEVLVVVAPFYLRSEWSNEVEKHGVKMPVFLWDDVPPPNQKPPFIVIMNIESARAGRGNEFLVALLAKHRCMLVLDESTTIKNFKSVSAKAMLAAAQLAALRRELSGLPMPHNVLDLYPQLRFLKQLNGVNPFVFRNKYAILGGYLGKQVKGAKNEEELQRIMDACSFRALKADWAKSLPPKIHVERQFEMTGRQKAAYKEMESDFVTFVKEGDPESAVFADQVMHAMRKLSQISRGFILDGEHVAQELVPLKDNPALNTLKACLDAVQGKSLVFTVHRHSTFMLFEALQSYGARMLIGGMSQDEIKQAKDDFNNDPAVKVFVLQTAVGHRGHNLTGQPGATTRCADTFWWENSFNFEHRAQGADRNHRWGTDADCVTYTDFICSKMDQKFLAGFKNKQNLVTAVLDAVRAAPEDRP